MATGKRDTADYYTVKARSEGYPARSVYKLKEIQDSFHLIRHNDTVLDVGSAPGSWTLYTQKQILKGSGRVVSVDLNPLNLKSVPENVSFIQGDAFSEEVYNQLIQYGPYDVIISDVAPMTTGNRTVDTAKSEYLVKNVIKLAEKSLKNGGNMVLKIFQGEGMREISVLMKTLFQNVRQFKPNACRTDSFEIYIIGTNRRKADYE